MTANEIRTLIESMLEMYPDRLSGNVVNESVANDLRPLAGSDRGSLVHALRHYLSMRVPASVWGPEHAIAEGRVPIYEAAVAHHLQRLQKDV